MAPQQWCLLGQTVMRLWLGSSGSMAVVRIGFGVGFLDSRCGHPIYPYRREKDGVQRVCCQLAWWKLGSPDEFVVFVFRQNRGLLWFVQWESHCSKALHDQRPPDLSQTESICGRFGESVPCFAQAARAVENEVLHAIADSERCLGAWYGVILMFLAVVIFNDPWFLFRLFLGRRDTKHFRWLSRISRTWLRTSLVKIQVPFWLAPQV